MVGAPANFCCFFFFFRALLNGLLGIVDYLLYRHLKQILVGVLLECYVMHLMDDKR